MVVLSVIHPSVNIFLLNRVRNSSLRAAVQFLVVHGFFHMSLSASPRARSEWYYLARANNGGLKFGIC